MPPVSPLKPKVDAGDCGWHFKTVVAFGVEFGKVREEDDVSDPTHNCIPKVPGRGRRITDDNLWRPTRRAKEHYAKGKLTTRRGAVHDSTELVEVSIGWLCG